MMLSSPTSGGHRGHRSRCARLPRLPCRPRTPNGNPRSGASRQGAGDHVPPAASHRLHDRRTADDPEDQIKSEVITYSASGFRDFMRIAGSDPVTWRDIFLVNREAVLEIPGRLWEDLAILQRAIRVGDGETLAFFRRTREIRRSVVEAGQHFPPAPPDREPEQARDPAPRGSACGKRHASAAGGRARVPRQPMRTAARPGRAPPAARPRPFPKADSVDGPDR